MRGENTEMEQLLIQSVKNTEYINMIATQTTSTKPINDYNVTIINITC